ncbi:hypothetical protein [Polyangium jinanense]|uniref:Uncharacterized protein n=1 Tax=Polyangium jinanense TaxID=2829994 RepID=A0A9X3XDT5_9BACT|nr:hypothetical protein [Polyangium jinanense]MDC3958679.1 hypothetical protein [Polyangium jinanense]MDC3988457.1 hypothetical protein [Polyangium jinanense]
MVSRARRSPSPALAALLAALPLGCGAPQTPAKVDANAPKPAESPAPLASTAPPPEAAPATNETPSPAPEKPARPPSPFYPLIVHGQPSFRMFVLPSFIAAISGDYLSTPIRIDGNGARVDGSLYAGLKGLGEQNAFYVMWITGDLPKHGKLGLNLPGERGGEDVFYSWKGSAWARDPDKPMPPAVSSAYYMGGIYSSAPWGDRALYEINDPNLDEAKPIFVLGPGGSSPPVPEIAKGTGRCKTKLLGHADLRALPSGDLIGFGKECREGDQPSFYGQSGAGPLAVERWPKGSRTSVIDVLPGSDVVTSLRPGSRFYVLGPNDVLAVALPGDRGAAYAAHWNGKSWSDISPGGSESVNDAFRTKDGSLWLLREKGLDRYTSGKWTTFTPGGIHNTIEWAKVGPDDKIWAGRSEELLTLEKDGFRVIPLPELDPREEGTPIDILFRGDEILVPARAGGQVTVLSTKKPTKVLDLDAPDEPAEGAPPPRPAPKTELHAFSRITPGTPGCKELFVVLYKLAKVAPPDYDFPLTRAALKGHTELSSVKFAETEDAGRRYFVAFVPSFSIGQKLVKTVQEGVKNSTPQLLCGKPARTNRDIRIDLRTGEIVKANP